MRPPVLLTVVTAALVVLATWALAGAGAGHQRQELLGGDSRAALRLWIMPNGPEPMQDMQRILAPFERQTGIRVQVQLVPWDVQFGRIRNAAESGAGPDVTQAGTTQVPFLASTGGFEDLASRVDDLGGERAYAPGVWRTTQLAGRRGTWSVPWFSEARAVYYRKDLLARAGLDPRTAFADWRRFRSTLRRLRDTVDPGTAPFGAPGRLAFDLVHSVAPFIWSAGGTEISADNRRSAIASPAAVRGVQFVAQLLRDGTYDPAMLDLDGQGVENAFKGGRLAVWIGGPWLLADQHNRLDTSWSAATRRNLGVAPMPAGPSGRGYSFVGGSNLMMMRSSAHKDEAWQLIRFLSQPATQRAYAAQVGMFPANLAAQRADARRDPNRATFLTAIKQGRSFAAIPNWAQVEGVYRDRLGTILQIAADRGPKPYSEAEVAAQLAGAAREADAALHR